MHKLKILILSGEVWQDATNGGNVLSNIFRGFDAEFAQIYCNPGSPQNSLCKLYYQMTDNMVIKNFFSHRPIGKKIEYSDYPDFVNQNDNNEEKSDIKRKSFFKKHSWPVFHFIRNFLWNHSNWKNDKLKNFILDFNPDIIFAPCYGNKFLLRLTRYVGDLTKKKIISYISDDSYTLNQFSLSLFYWFNRFSVRRQMRKTFPYYSLCYTMTETQKLQCEKDFNANMKILLKGNTFPQNNFCEEVHSPINIVYAGGIYLKRWKTLVALRKAISRINIDGVKVVLNIYTANELSKKMQKFLNDGVNTFSHDKVSLTELAKIYENADIALHVESFSLKQRLQVRMSFSTKIVDCLSSGCACLAICDKKQGGYLYLKNNDVAICIDNLKDINNVLYELVKDTNVIFEYKKKARDFCVKNHDVMKIGEMVYSDFYKVLKLNESCSN